MLTAKSHGEFMSASPVPEVSDASSRRPLPAGVVGARRQLLRRASLLPMPTAAVDLVIRLLIVMSDVVGYFAIDRNEE